MRGAGALQRALCPGLQQYFPQASLGRAANKAGIDPSNEPTQHSLLLDLYLLKSGEEESASFSTFPGICQIIDWFPSPASIFWNAWDWERGAGVGPGVGPGGARALESKRAPERVGGTFG